MGTWSPSISHVCLGDSLDCWKNVVSANSRITLEVVRELCVLETVMIVGKMSFQQILGLLWK